VIGELTLSRTSDFIRRHSVALSTTVNSFILCLLLGNIGSHDDLTSGRQGQQAKESNWARDIGTETRPWDFVQGFP
jgi:hypothetical protein